MHGYIASWGALGQVYRLSRACDTKSARARNKKRVAREMRAVDAAEVHEWVRACVTFIAVVLERASATGKNEADVRCARVSMTIDTKLKVEFDKLWAHVNGGRKLSARKFERVKRMREFVALYAVSELAATEGS